MTYSVHQFRQSCQHFSHKPAVRRSAIGIVVFILLLGLFGYFVLPGIIKSQAEKIISEKLHRKTTIAKVDINPYTMQLTLHGFKMMEPEGDVTFASFDSVMVNLSAQSLFRFAPVIQQLQIVKPYVHLVRKDANHYNIDDILALANSEPEKPEAEHAPARFSIFNIQLTQGHIDFDDRFAQTRHTVADLKLGIPFISSLPSQEEIYVEPYLSASVNGTPLLIKGKTLPFADPVEATMDFNLDNLDLTSYLKYIPGTPHFDLPSAKLDMHLVARFQQPKEKAPQLSLSGDIKLKALQLNDAKGKSIAKLHELAVHLNDTKLFNDQFAVARVTIDGLDADIARDRAGHFNFENLLTPPKRPAAIATSKTAAEPKEKAAVATAKAKPPVTEKSATPKDAQNTVPEKSASAPMQFVLGELDIRNTGVRYNDAQSASALQAELKNLALNARAININPGKKLITVADLSSNSAALDLQQGSSKNKAGAAPEKPKAAVKAKQTPAQEKAGYIVNVARISISNWSAKLQDRSLRRPAVTVIAPLNLTLQNLSTAANARSQIDLQAQVNKSGQLHVSGDFGIAPLHAKLALDLKNVDILQLQPYFTDQVNILLTSAEVSSKGNLLLDQGKNGALNGGFKGDVALGNVTTIDKITSQNFLRWKSLAFNDMDVKLAPFSLAVDHVLLDNFFARVIIDPKGRINLQDVQRSKQVGDKSVTQAGATADSSSTTAAAAEKKSSPSSNTAVIVKPEKPETAMPPIKVRKVTLSHGRVRFTDNFIKPNYTANLEKFGGTITNLSSDEKTRANVDIKGEVNDAPMSVAGTINPLKRDLSLDIKAEVHGMELAPLSPYSGRYIGYGIEKGKLSFEVAYQVENRVLTAQNRLILDQLTLGDKVESPTATTLPVRFALTLLRDRNGVIDLNLPIGGSLDDPQFSVGGLIVKVIVNLLSKAVTAPFALLSSMLGGGEELSFLPFDAGQAKVDDKGEKTLKTIAKALLDRPTLKLEITAHADPKTDVAGLKRAAIDRKVKALKLKDTVQSGKSVDPDQIKISEQEYPKLLDRVYKDADFKKQRNFIGIQKDLPVPEMEKLLMEHTAISDDNLMALANRRAQNVKDWLIHEGKVPAERIFVLASKLGASSTKNDKAVPVSRVDFSLK